jgi:HK97 family phage major capsid protein
LNTSGVDTTTVIAAIGSDMTADLMGLLDSANVDAMRGFLTNAVVIKQARKVQDADNHVIPFAELFHAEPVSWTNQVPADLGVGSDKSALIYGDWSDLIIAYWSGIDLLANPYSNAGKGSVTLHAFLDANVAVRHVESFAANVAL